IEPTLTMVLRGLRRRRPRADEGRNVERQGQPFRNRRAEHRGLVEPAPAQTRVMKGHRDHDVVVAAGQRQGISKAFRQRMGERLVKTVLMPADYRGDNLIIIVTPWRITGNGPRLAKMGRRRRARHAPIAFMRGALERNTADSAHWFGQALDPPDTFGAYPPRRFERLTSTTRRASWRINEVYQVTEHRWSIIKDCRIRRQPRPPWSANGSAA